MSAGPLIEKSNVWAVTLDANNKEQEWNRVSTEPEASHNFAMRQVVITPECKQDEVQVVELEAVGFDGATIKAPIFADKGVCTVRTEMVLSDQKVKFRLLAGSGPIYISGTHATESGPTSEEDDIGEEELEEEVEDEENDVAATNTLYTYPKNFRAYKALIAAKYSGAQVKVDSSFQFGVTNKTDAFLAKFPLGKVPAFESKNGEHLFDSNAIAYAVSNQALKGASPLEQAQVLQWLNFAELELLPGITKWVFPCLGLMGFNKNTYEEAREDVTKCLNLLNSHLLSRTFLVGERISLADIVVTCNLLRLYEHIMDKEFRSAFVHVNRWFDTIVHQNEVKSVIGDFKWCTKMAVFDNKKFAEVQAQLHGGDAKKSNKKEKAEKKEKPAPVKKEEKKEEEEPKPKPSGDPISSLPAGSFNMDEFKRFYSNNDENLSVPWFWEHFDKENYSIWFCEYKYPEELSKIFMTCNLVGGMFQRLEKLRKNAFASVCVFGKDGANAISGVWVWRGHELVFPLCPDWQIDYESYDWRKLDANTDETKKLVNQYFKWEGEDSQARPFNQGKIYK